MSMIPPAPVWFIKVIAKVAAAVARFLKRRGRDKSGEQEKDTTWLSFFASDLEKQTMFTSTMKAESSMPIPCRRRPKAKAIQQTVPHNVFAYFERNGVSRRPDGLCRS